MALWPIFRVARFSRTVLSMLVARALKIGQIADGGMPPTYETMHINTSASPVDRLYGTRRSSFKKRCAVLVLQPRSAGDRLVADWQHIESVTVKMVRAAMARNHVAH
jgi:hypothetical protein